MHLERDDQPETYLDSGEYELEEPGVELDVDKFKQDVDKNFAKIQVNDLLQPDLLRIFQGYVSLSTLRLSTLPYYTMLLQRIRIIVGENAGFEPGTSVQEVLCATNAPPHLHQSVLFHNIQMNFSKNILS